MNNNKIELLKTQHIKLGVERVLKILSNLDADTLPQAMGAIHNYDDWLENELNGMEYAIDASADAVTNNE